MPLNESCKRWRAKSGTDPKQQTWDLSPNDVDAIRWAITTIKWQEEVWELIHAKADQLALIFKRLRGEA